MSDDMESVAALILDHLYKRRLTRYAVRIALCVAFEAGRKRERRTAGRAFNERKAS